MNYTQSSLNQYLTSSQRKPLFKVELFLYDEVPYLDLTPYIVNGSFSYSASLTSGARKAVSFSLYWSENIQMIMSPVFPAVKFNLRVGYEENGADYLYDIGIFYIEQKRLQTGSEGKTISIEGVDKWALLDGTVGGIFDGNLVIAKDDDIRTVVSRLLFEPFVGDFKRPLIDSTLETFKIPYDIEITTGQTVSEVFIEIADSLSAWVYYDNLGHLRFEKDIADEHRHISYEFQENDINLVSVGDSFGHTDYYNAVIVIAENTQSANTFISEVINNSPIDPYSYINTGVKKTKIVNENVKNIDTQELCDERARWELKVASSKNGTVNIDCLFLPQVEVGSAVLVKNGSSPSTYIIQSISGDFGDAMTASMTGSAVRNYK